MRIAANNPTRRQAFTLIELMVVIVIVGILVALTTAAVVKALGKGRQVQTRTEISEVAVGVQNFNAKHGAYPPSRIKLCEKFSQYFTVPADLQLDTDSVAFLRRMFPRMFGDTSITSTDTAHPWTYNNTSDPNVNNYFVDWNGDGALDGPFLLEGQQCLVFFLGGIPANTGGPASCLGFSTQATNPAAHIANPSIGAQPLLFEFPSNRLLLAANTFYTFLDPYRALPYAYFSSYNVQNGYNRYYAIYGNSDCISLALWPYAEAVPIQIPNPGANSIPGVRYVNRETFQIISAGADALIAGGGFGTGTVITGVITPPDPRAGQLTGGPVWTLKTASQVYPQGNPGADDMSNFSDSMLGVSP